MMRKLLVGVSVVLLALSVGALTQQPRMGAWVDEVVFTEEKDLAAGVSKLEANEIDIYAFAIAKAELLKRVRDIPALTYVTNFGSYNELTFNPVGPTFPGTGAFNPFHFPKIREAMNWLVDRDYIVGEIMGGLGVPKYFGITAAFPDYTRYIDKVKELEEKYAHNPEKAKAIITEEMKKAGAELVDGKWYYGGKPVELIFLIRVEDERKIIGDYVSALLEDLGFTVKREYKTAKEAAACWIKSDPATGCFHIYTGGWITTVIARDQGGNFNFFYTPRGAPVPLWMAYTPAPEFDELADRLARRDYTSMAERKELFERVLELSMEDSVRVWLVDATGFTPFRKGVGIAADLAGGVYGAYLWALTAQFGKEVEPGKWQPVPGGKMRIAMPGLIIEPWNPIAGSNWIYDMMPIRGTSDWGTMWDPTNGLHWPQRIERGEVYIQEGLPVERTYDWVTLTFVPGGNPVPADAWCDWDAVKQEFITCGEKFPGGVTAKRKSVVYYPADLYDIPLHDGSKLDLADFVMGMILTFDRAKPESPIYDEAAVPDFKTFMKHFRGVKIVSEKPLVIETYSDLYYLDAEWNVSTWFPFYDQGPGFWHALTLGIMAETNKELAFSVDKADELKIEWMNYTAGPSIPILEKYLEEAIKINYIPYAPTLGKYITTEEAANRYANLKAWYGAKGHFWVGSGVLYLEKLYPVEKIVHLKRFPDYPDPAEKWQRFVLYGPRE